MERNSKVRKFITVVIDGSDEDLVYFIKSTIDEMTNKEHGEAICSPLKKGYSSMMLIETTTESRTYASIQYVIEKVLPGKCLFNYTV